MSKNTKDIVNQSKYLCWIFSAFEILAELTMGWIMLKINVSQGERMVKQEEDDWLEGFDVKNAAIIAQFVLPVSEFEKMGDGHQSDNEKNEGHKESVEKRPDAQEGVKEIND